METGKKIEFAVDKKTGIFMGKKRLTRGKKFKFKVAIKGDRQIAKPVNINPHGKPADEEQA